jgi:hypothetical protein
MGFRLVVAALLAVFVAGVVLSLYSLGQSPADPSLLLFSAGVLFGAWMGLVVAVHWRADRRATADS